MIKATVLVVVLVLGPASAWPISPLERYENVENVVLHCGDSHEQVMTSHAINFTFSDTAALTSNQDCFIHIRLEELSEAFEMRALHVEGWVDLDDADNLLTGVDRCKSSYVSFEDQDDPKDEMGHLDRFCKHDTIEFNTTEDIVNMYFKVAPHAVQGSGFGFLAYPVHLCGGVVTSTQEVTSPEYPQPYPKNVGCFWVIKGESISLAFPEFDLRPKKKKRCDDYVKVISSGGKHETFCGDSLKGQTLSYSDHVYVEFRSSNKVFGHAGFRSAVTVTNANRNQKIMSKFYEQ